MLLSGPSVSDLQPCFCLFIIVGACFFFLSYEGDFPGSAVHTSVPSWPSEPALAAHAGGPGAVPTRLPLGSVMGESGRRKCQERAQPVSGPVSASLRRGCAGVPGQAAYSFAHGSAGKKILEA